MYIFNGHLDCPFLYILNGKGGNSGGVETSQHYWISNIHFCTMTISDWTLLWNNGCSVEARNVPLKSSIILESFFFLFLNTKKECSSLFEKGLLPLLYSHRMKPEGWKLKLPSRRFAYINIKFISHHSVSDPTRVAFLRFLAVRCLMITSSSLLSSSLSSLLACLPLWLEAAGRFAVRLLPRPEGRRLLLSSGSSLESNNENKSLNFFFWVSLQICCTCCNACCMLSCANNLISACCCFPPWKEKNYYFGFGL